MSAHTPGPWSFRSNYHKEGKFEVRSGGSGHASAYAPLAYVQGDKRETGGNGEANARLMAAAPDLLAACQRLLVEVRWEAARADVVTDEARADIALAVAAIAKATGVTP